MSSGPSRLNSVRKGSALRCGATCANAGWKCGAKRKVNGVRGMCAAPAVGAGKAQPSAWRRSADPEDEVEARPPCCAA